MKNSNSNNKKTRNHVAILLMVVSALSFSCSDIYDNIDKYVDNEIIYVEGLDDIMRVHVGYERVEIDLLEAGRIPSSMIRTNKATKTVIECADFTEPGHRRVIDSICSWVNVTGLTELKTYRLNIYTEDNYGNKSLPLVADVVPYTKENLNALELVAPSVLESTSAALLEWKDRISAITHTVYSYAYSYSDKDGKVRTGGEDGDLPSFLVENVEKGKDIPITMTCKIVPKIMEAGAYTSILDSIEWQTTINLRISERAEPAIFLKTPAALIEIDMLQAEDYFPISFSWTKVPEATGYAVMLSTDPGFPEGMTHTINLGNVNEYVMEANEGVNVLNSLPKARQQSLYWTVVPTAQTAPVKNQTRRITVNRLPVLVGKWQFENETNLGEATVGQDLIPVGSGFELVDGPSLTKKAVRVTKGSYYKCLHGLPSGTDMFTIMLNVKKPVTTARHNGLVQMNPNNNDNAEMLWNSNWIFGADGTSFPGNHYCLAAMRWYQVVMVSDGNSKTFYVDGERSHSVINADVRYSLNQAGLLLFTGGTATQYDNDIDVSEVAIWDMPLTEDEIHMASGLRKLNKAGWSVTSYSNGASGLNSLFDNNINSNWASPLPAPAYVVIDLGETRDIGRIVYYGPNAGARIARTMQFSVSNSPVSGWVQVIDHNRTIQGPNAGGGNLISFNFPETEVKGRYLQLYLPDTWPNTALFAVAEISVYEKIKD
jgi:hypothetical protein